MNFLKLVPRTLGLAIIAAAQSSCSSPQPTNAQIFNAAWSLARDHYYDRTFNGFDWNAVRATYRDRATSAQTRTELYNEALIPMFELLENSHTGVRPPSGWTGALSVSTSRFDPWALADAGMVIASGRPLRMGRVVHVVPGSLGARKGVRTGWVSISTRLMPLAKGSFGVEAVYLTPHGKQVAVDYGSFAGSGSGGKAAEAAEDAKFPGHVEVSAMSPEGFNTVLDQHKGRKRTVTYHLEPLGLYVTEHPGTPFTVADVIKGSEADRQAIAPGSTLEAFRVTPQRDGMSRAELTIASPGGGERQVDYLFRRADKPYQSPPPTASLLPGGALYLRFDSFDVAVPAWLERQLLDHPGAHAVLDLRYNSGGRVAVADKVLGLFLPVGSNIGYDLLSGMRSARFTNGKPVFAGRVSVLVGPISASAAEVTAAALQHHRRAALVGSVTSGNVLRARRYPLPDGGTAMVADRDYLTPGGRRIEKVGVRPDVEASQTLAAVRAGRDLVIEAALQPVQ